MRIVKDKNQSKSAIELRNQAEEQLFAKSAELHPPRSKQENLRLVHELEVHQIELEMQNAELFKTSEQMETILKKYTDLYDFAPVGYCTTDREGVIQSANLTLATLLGIGRSKLVGCHLGPFVEQEIRNHFSVFLGDVFNSSRNISFEARLAKEGDYPLFVRIEACTFNDGRECNLAITDVSGRKRAEESFHQNRMRLEWVLEKTSVGLWLNELPLNRLTWDAQTRRLFFVDPDVEPTIGLFWSRVHPDDHVPTRLAVENAIQNKTLYEIDHRTVNPVTGEIRWIHSAGQTVYATDGTPISFDGINYDITERKQIEDIIQGYNTDLRSVNAELNRFNSVAVEREIRMIELKKEINELCKQYGQPPRYPLDFVKECQKGP